jgi:superfamily II DNA or RNA helicase
MNLRVWQKECIEEAISRYQSGQSHFLCLATPGAGKTLMASRLAKRLIDDDLIDLIICITPAIIVSDDFKNELEVQLGKKLNGKLGSIGRCLTYHAMLSENNIWDLFEDHRVFVIFDEIHHCSGNDLHNSNAWGQKIISEIQGKASYTLALTGTPWRSDNIPITLGQYSNSGTVHCDYLYGLTRAVEDKVCRTPSITLIDNNKITLTESGSSSQFNSFETLFKDSKCNYQSLIESESLIEYMLKQADRKLNTLRKIDDKSGGLIVASSVSHARNIHKTLKRLLNEDAHIVTYLEPDAVSLIKQYKGSKTKWIISVGMISEGTNIPRLKVCCYLTRVKTELYFRQVLGRVLRADGSENDTGFFYMPAEPTLSEYAYRVDQDIPNDNIIKVETIYSNNQGHLKRGAKNETIGTQTKPSAEVDIQSGFSNDAEQYEASTLSKEYEHSLGLFGQFQRKVLNLNELL